MAAHVLVLANVTASSGDLIDAIRQRAEKGPIDVTLLMPGQGPGLVGPRGRARAARRRARRLARGRDRGRGHLRRRQPDGRRRRDLGPAPPRRGDRLDAAGPELALDRRRPAGPRRAAHRRAGHARRGQRHAARAARRAAAGARDLTARAARRPRLGTRSRRVAPAGCRTGPPCRSAGLPGSRSSHVDRRARGLEARGQRVELGLADDRPGVRLRRGRERLGVDADVQLLAAEREPGAAARAHRLRLLDLASPSSPP